jgi:hypothetical protein
MHWAAAYHNFGQHSDSPAFVADPTGCFTHGPLWDNFAAASKQHERFYSAVRSAKHSGLICGTP